MNLQEFIDSRKPLALEQENALILSLSRGLRREAKNKITSTIRYNFYSFFDDLPEAKELKFDGFLEDPDNVKQKELLRSIKERILKP